MAFDLSHYRKIELTDFEYGQRGCPGGAHEIRCMVSREFRTGRTIKLWLDGLSNVPCPLDLGEDVLHVNFYSGAEGASYESLDWPAPARVLDLSAELRMILNGHRSVMDEYLKEKKIGRKSLLGALYHFGLFSVAIDAAEKTEMRDLAFRGGTYTKQERKDLLDYCETDVIALAKLLEVMSPCLKDTGHALFRGRYAFNVTGTIEYNGIPVNGPKMRAMKDNWDEVVQRLIDRKTEQFDVLKHRDVDVAKLETWLDAHGVTYWPVSPGGQLSTNKDDLKDMARMYGGTINELAEYLSTVRQARMFESLKVGDDDRHRFMQSPFASKTSRNQPSSSQCIFGPGVWVRSMIQPAPGRALAYCDYAGQEYFVAGALSGDELMLADYDPDPYLGFARRVRLVPPDATKKTHGEIRSRLKICLGLGCLYGAGFRTVARAGDMLEPEARNYLWEHRMTYVDFWEWRQCVITHGGCHDEMVTPLGWVWHVGDATGTTISNWPMQSLSADMLRAASCEVHDAGVQVVGLLHDAILIEAPISEFEDAIAVTVDRMEYVSELLTGRPGMRVDVDRIEHPNHFTDGRGTEMWRTMNEILEEVLAENGCDSRETTCSIYRAGDLLNISSS